MTTPHTITVLGLGRLGAPIAARLAERGWHVIGWTRSGHAAAGAVEPAGEANEAVQKADIVLLCLFDAAACEQVLDQVRDSLRPDAAVLNTSTVAPSEAAALAARFGPNYVHAPVLGSGPAVANGALRILAAGNTESFDTVRPVLEALGTVQRVDDAATAAALKLVANSSLAGAVLGLRDSLQQADALGLSRAAALDVLELGSFGGLVARKRDLLTEPSATATATGTAGTADATFTIGALAKDMALLADATDKPLPSAAELADTPAGPEADIAMAATAPAVDDAVLEAVLEPLRAYIRGHATRDPAHFREAFLGSAHIEGIRDGVFVSWPLDDYCAMFDGQPAEDESTRTRRIDSVRVHGSVASAGMTLKHGPDTFTDIFLLVHVGDGWRIANKAYHRHS
ncbi:nuclear transport factor 2 family protein [Catenulispora pinisilvae]|uniref:nuclear transport factor 2 family protein n=1 Tax=Catenulispora pinisilvae TaxID=2705253 RepID=UPI00189154C9|nr:nuclear transport factor 2 family protein [Catenulispora pinisilvae]